MHAYDMHACVWARVLIWRTSHDIGSVRCRGERVRPSAEILQTAPHVGVSKGNWRPVVRWADASIHPSLLASCIHPKCFSTELTQCRALWLAHLMLDTIRVSSNGHFWTQKWSKMVLPKTDPAYFGQVHGAYSGSLGPVLARFQAPVGPKTAACSEQFSGQACTHGCWRGVCGLADK